MYFKFSPLLICLLFSIVAVKSQQNINGSDLTSKASQPTDNNLHINPTKQPEYIGGVERWKKYVDENLNINIPLIKQAPAGQYVVVVRCIISYWGSLINVIAETKHGYGLEDEAIRLVKNVPRWKPAFLDGRPVNAFMRQSVSFVVPAH